MILFWECTNQPDLSNPEYIDAFGTFVAKIKSDETAFVDEAFCALAPAPAAK